MMTLGELRTQAKNGDAKAAVRLSDALRGQGFRYADVADFARDGGIEANDWEALLLEGDQEDGR